MQTKTEEFVAMFLPYGQQKHVQCTLSQMFEEAKKLIQGSKFKRHEVPTLAMLYSASQA